MPLGAPKVPSGMDEARALLLRKVFDSWDVDGAGYLRPDTIRNGMKALCINPYDNILSELMCDPENTSRLRDRIEFFDFLEMMHRVIPRRGGGGDGGGGDGAGSETAGVDPDRSSYIATCFADYANNEGEVDLHSFKRIAQGCGKLGPGGAEEDDLVECLQKINRHDATSMRTGTLSREQFTQIARGEFFTNHFSGAIADQTERRALPVSEAEAFVARMKLERRDEKIKSVKTTAQVELERTAAAGDWAARPMGRNDGGAIAQGDQEFVSSSKHLNWSMPAKLESSPAKGKHHHGSR